MECFAIMTVVAHICAACTDNEACSPPPEVEGAIAPRLEGTTYAVGTVVNYECNFGYVSHSSGSLSVCRINESTGKAEWTIPDISCIKIYCPVPPDPVNGRALYSSLEYGSELRYECNEGFTSKSNQTRICQSDGKWSNNEPECKGLLCQGDPPAIANGSPVIGNRQHGWRIWYNCDKGFEKTKTGIVECIHGTWKGESPVCSDIGKSRETSSETSTRHVYGVTPTESIDSFTRPVDECFCTYDYRTDVLEATVDTRILEGEKIIEKGETLSLSCFYPLTVMVWPSGLRISGTVNLPCNTCQHWHNNDLPTCEIYEKGDSLILYNINMKFLPGGIIEIPKAKSIEFQCVNSWLQPLWYAGNRQGITFSVDNNEILRENGFYGAYMIIASSDDEHTGTYECSTYDRYRRYKSATLNLKITDYVSCETFQSSPGIEVSYSDDVRVGSNASFRCSPPNTLFGSSFAICQSNGTWSHDLPSCKEPDIQCPELLMNTKKGSFIIVYENNRKVNTKAYYSCKDSTQKLIGSDVRRCSENGKWSGSYPSCEGHQDPDKMCPWNQFRCVNSRCISESFICDGDNDCGDWTDESKCPGEASCGDREFECDDGLCINKDWQCDGESDCHDMSDERNCEPDIQCPELQRNTKKGNFIIVYENNRKVNTIAYYSCKDSTQKLIGSDVRRCSENGKWSGSYPSCEDITCPKFTPYNGLVIRYTNGNKVNSIASFRCTQEDTLIGSNISICQHSGNWSKSMPSCEIGEESCRDHEFQCDDVWCIPKHWKCDGAKDCNDMSDERDCPSQSCGPSEFRCNDGGCIIRDWACNGYVDCQDGSDERDCGHEDPDKMCPPNQFRCVNSRCISESFICDGDNDCGDWSDESKCPGEASCGDREFQCDDGLCINKDWLCDGENDCDDMSDERNCEIPECSEEEFQCREGKCIMSGWRCDGEFDCADNSDEDGCDYVSCDRFRSSPGLEVSYSDDVRVGSTASFRCPPLNTLFGSSSAVCQSNGTWSHGLPSCKDYIICERFQSSPGLEVSYSDDVRVGSTASFRCSSSYTLFGSSSAICQSNGTWSYDLPWCKGVSDCQLSKDAFPNLLTDPEKEFYRFGEFILLSCPPGLKLTSEVKRIMCLGKTWSDDIPNCTEEDYQDWD